MQLPLPIHQVDDETFDNFYAENSLVLLDSLRQNFVDVQQPFFYIWGGKSSGKSHLLKAVSNHYLLNQQTSSYIPLEKSQYFSPMVLDNAEQLDVICLDDLQVVAGDEAWELAIFNLFNQIREQQGLFGSGHKTLLLISADCPPHQLKINLPDLRSRLTWGEVYQLNDLTDDQKRIILQRNAYQKGMELSDEVANFLLKRLDRDLQTLSTELDRLDRASLQAQRKLTVPFVKEILGL
ncbi:DnaA regulatory inactivator Hda [Actinobacillus equuli]|uniref:DnaA regulatory inactivator Hda n=2 Tax=Actinobacillus equuli TaxID=718 RepID=A0A0A7MI35_ACTEU|nr:DnaA regulatory inactivator Hda [Actinobacillus equuli]AIZ80290.1 DNA replication protein [Actinobacillus equuli subsp. equuli]MDE8033980.1 DnaA regulatory inactivator Hda [Actinobacillus equuli subsp. equuli]MDG4947378.1 DnaA regulatory inactivator Hda [Actinobacillus equuli subsp. haemolyticus]WGE44394.1 DnaA regulatory inactivator Hda [Actinobacillus equuli subsp. equuli]WGE48658.1 DnaA regulatory inactivator Hda [Actinobacillus equuli subsp. equuli]